MDVSFREPQKGNQINGYHAAKLGPCHPRMGLKESVVDSTSKGRAVEICSFVTASVWAYEVWDPTHQTAKSQVQPIRIQADPAFSWRLPFGPKRIDS